MRLIDADELKKDISGAKKLGIEAVAYYIDQQPTAVVRCGECKYYLKSRDECGIIETTLQFYAERKRWTEDSFCSWGEQEVQE